MGRKKSGLYTWQGRGPITMGYKIRRIRAATGQHAVGIELFQAPQRYTRSRP